MGEMKHTPGEWVADRDCDYGKQPRVHAGDRLVCVVGNSETDRQDQWEADAALISAAKELLALVKMVHGSFGGGLVMTFTEADVEAFAAALSKASPSEGGEA